MKPHFQLTVFLITLMSASAALFASADVAFAGERTYKFTLTTGGELRGTLQNEGQTPRETYIIETNFGVITLDREQIVDQTPISDAQLEYEGIAANYADDAEGQWELAQWCKENGLPKERRTHAEKVLEHDPDHALARAFLGFFLDRSTGRWITQEQLREEQGYVKYQGEWLLQQQVQLREERRTADLARKTWMREVARLHRQLTGRRNSEEGQEAILQIKDPAAVPALAQRVMFDKEQNPLIRELYVKALSNIGSPDALQLLAGVILADPSDEVRYRAIEEIAKHKDHKITRLFVQKLSADKNDEINRAAAALSAIGDLSAVESLINSLITTHIKIHREGNPDQITTSFGPNGANGLTTGSRTETETRTLKNEDVRNALINLTGKNFGWDMDLWKSWLASETKAAIVNPRRGN